MNRTRRFRPARRLAGILAALATILLAVASMTPAAFALPQPPLGGGSGTLPPVQTVVGGMPGWQIALIGVTTAVVAVFLDRVWTGRRHKATPST
jgi:hypothetical protein